MTTILAFVNSLAGSKTYIAAAGLVGLAIYQASQGQGTEAVQSLLQALTAAGLRSAIASTTTATAK